MERKILGGLVGFAEANARLSASTADSPLSSTYFFLFFLAGELALTLKQILVFL